ncbi:hypothetical protein [Actinoplanes sp. NPDC051859]|uniref:hypothetical protein n=1 Tax=Actinoplanes sp. NPDC051859 TaxID=3363909 RepID=UPI00378880D2
MTADVVTPLVLPAWSGPARSRPAAGPGLRKVALARLATVRERSSVYAMVAVEDRGRVTVHSVVHVLPWDPDTRLAVRVQARLVVVTADADGESQIDRKGRLQVRVAMRRWCGLTQGSRVLLVADPATERLVVHPSAALDATIGRAHAEAFGGDA